MTSGVYTGVNRGRFYCVIAIPQSEEVDYDNGREFKKNDYCTMMTQVTALPCRP